ncbi:50S ribosomal protein L15 [Candidatus Uhrbacteria bacterium]|nr:50S ribosomal protein L15 [Candidatus Uhrbacteria bacterium]
MSQHTLHPAKGARHRRKLVGRGLGKKGTYSGRGGKGQTARSGVSGLRLMGLRRLMLSTPKSRGFASGKPKPSVVNVAKLSLFSSGTVVTPELLIRRGIVLSSPAGVKILGTGAVGAKLTVKGCRVSASAKQKILEAGGTIA